MKHPKYRTRDILVLDPVVRDEVYDYIRKAVDVNVPLWIKDMMLEIQHVGSYTWGGAKLHSDMDFNVALNKDVLWKDYVAARRWFYSSNRSGLADACMKFSVQTGLKLDVGLIDIETDRYNCYVSLREMMLYHRTTQMLTEFEIGDVGVITDIEDLNPINLLTFDPAVMELPPQRDQHLRWDGYAFRWRVILQEHPWKRDASWMEDEYEAEIEKWKAQYGQNYIDWESITDNIHGTRLVEK